MTIQEHDQAVIEIHNLTRKFGNFTAVDTISLTIDQGQIFGFLGPNGSGKTTTIRMLLGLLPPTSGTALVLGHDIRRQALSIRARLGYMSQKFTLYNDLSVEENLRFYGRGYGLRNTHLKTRMAEVLELAGLVGREHDKPPELSGGWRQRLALGAAIIHQPDIVFLDEPTAGVDPVSRREFWDLLYRLSAEGTTIFVTTHYMDEAEHCEQLAFIYYGRIIAEGSPNTIKSTQLPGDLIQVTTNNPANAIALLQTAHQHGNLGNSMDVSLYGAQIHIVTEDAQSSRKEVVNTLEQAGETIIDIDVIPPSLEDAFIRLVQTQQN